MKVDIDVPDGKSGAWAVSTFEVSEADASLHNILCMMHGQSRRSIRVGTYKALTRNGNVIMSNTPAECSDHWPILHNAHGQVLINGLGLGVVLKMILNKDKYVTYDARTVDAVTVIEKSEDVIKLVGPTYTVDPRVTIIHADAYDWKPPKGVRYNAVWHDIWNNITSDNLETMGKLHRKYGRRADWQGSWCRAECKRLQRSGWR